MTMKLIGANVCPFVHRVRLSLAEKGLQHEYVSIDLRNKPDWYHDVLPTGRVPLLEHDGVRIWESHILCEYLEDAFPETPLLPDSAALRAQVRLFVNQEVGEFITVFYKLLSSQDAEQQEEQKARFLSVLERLEEKLGEHPGDFYLPQLSLADFELYPWFERLCVLEHYRSWIVPESFSRVHRWQKAVGELESVKSLRESEEFFIEQYRDYAVGNAVPK